MTKRLSGGVYGKFLGQNSWMDSYRFLSSDLYKISANRRIIDWNSHGVLKLSLLVFLDKYVKKKNKKEFRKESLEINSRGSQLKITGGTPGKPLGKLSKEFLPRLREISPKDYVLKKTSLDINGCIALIIPDKILIWIPK